MQVVMLGAGMDTRPWRIELPPGIYWFEVDRPDVMRAKQQELVSAGAQISKTHSDGKSIRTLQLAFSLFLMLF